MENTIRGEGLSKHGKKYPSIGEYVLTKIVDMYSPQGTDEVHMEIDIPEKDNDGIWVFGYPYSWDTNIVESLPAMAEELGYNRKNFHEMVGEPVLVKPNNENELSVLIVNKAEDRIHELYENEEVDIRDIDAEAIEENFDIELPFEVPDHNEIVFEGDMNELIESIR